MKFNDAFKGNYIKHADLGAKTKTLVIASVAMETVGEDHKPVMRFDGISQGLVLNKTNASVLRDAFGEEMDDWAGQKIQLRPDKTDFNGKRVDCVRVAVPFKQTPPAEAAQEAVEDDMTV